MIPKNFIIYMTIQRRIFTCIPYMIIIPHKMKYIYMMMVLPSLIQIIILLIIMSRIIGISIIRSGYMSRLNLLSRAGRFGQLSLANLQVNPNPGIPDMATNPALRESIPVKTKKIHLTVTDRLRDLFRNPFPDQINRQEAEMFQDPLRDL